MDLALNNLKLICHKIQPTNLQLKCKILVQSKPENCYIKVKTKTLNRQKLL